MLRLYVPRRELNPVPEGFMAMPADEAGGGGELRADSMCLGKKPTTSPASPPMAATPLFVGSGDCFPSSRVSALEPLAKPAESGNTDVMTVLAQGTESALNPSCMVCSVK